MKALITIGVVGMFFVPAGNQVPPHWPDAKTLEAERADAEARKLFASEAMLAFTLTADFTAVQEDRAGTRVFPATIAFTNNDGSKASSPLQIRTRGHERRMARTCEFAPLRLEFSKDNVRGTVFDGQKALKLNVHCRPDRRFEQYPAREYAVYKILNLITPRSFRVRLAKGTYVDASTKETLAVRYAVFEEDDGDLAKRMVGKVIDQQILTFKDLDPETLDVMSVFEFMIGNTDVSISPPPPHNVKTVATPGGVLLYPVPYDFDYSGAVNTLYAVPDPKFRIFSVRDRLYRGPCRTPAELEETFKKFRAARAGIPAIYDAIPDLDPGYKKDVLNYFDQFYKKLDNPGEIKKAFIDKCSKDGVM